VSDDIKITTERLVLVPFDRAWRQDLIRLHRDPVVAHWLFVSGKAPPDEDNDNRIAHYEALWAERGYGIFAVTDKRNGAFLGRAGPVMTPETGRIEVVWSMLSTVHGQGLATEAAQASIDFTFARSDLATLEAYVRPDNTPSQRVAAKLGFSLIDERFLYGMTLNFYRLERRRSGTH